MKKVNTLFATTIFLSLFIIFYSNIEAQEFGGFPSHKKFRAVKNKYIQVIYPKGLDSIAKEVLFTTNQLDHQKNYNITSQPSKINIILQNQITVANGYVGLGPLRSEFFLTPSADNFDLGTASWTQQLSIHEFRHVQQYNSFKNGVSKWAYKIFGDEVFDAAVNVVIPNWYFEGDAVFTETRLTHQGRGEMPSFLKRIPALWQSNKNYSWMKLRNGSIKDFTPNHYDLGYQLIKYGYDHYGSDFWKHVTKDASKYKGVFYPFQKAIKRNSGINFKQFKKNTLQNLEHQYKSNGLLNYQELFTDRITLQYKTYTNYLQPKIKGDSVLYIKESFKQNPEFIILSNNIETKIAPKYLSIESGYGYNDNKIVYTAYSKHPRWNWITYNNIVVLDVLSGKQNKITARSKYFTPDISPNGKNIAVAEYNEYSKPSLVILNTENGTVNKYFSLPNATYYSSPKFVNDTIVVSALRYADGRTAIYSFNTNTDESKLILPKTNRILGQLSTKNNTIYFSVSDSLQDKIGRYNINDSAVYFLVSKDLGSYMPDVSEEKLIRSVFSATGYFLKSSKLDNAKWQKKSIEDFAQTHYFDTIIHKQIIQPQPIPFTDTTYSNTKNIFNFHSWRPDYTAPIYSIAAYGNNILNTAATQLQYSFNENEKSHTLGGSFMYGGLFPIFNLSSNYTLNRFYIADSTKHLFNQFTNQLGASIPLSFIKKNNYISFTIQSSINNKQLYFKDSTPKNVALNNWYLFHAIQYSVQKQTARMQILPQWAFGSSLQYRYTLDKKQYNQLVAQIRFNVPGILKTHTLQFNNVGQWNNIANNYFASRVPYARGNNFKNAKSTFTNSVNYHLPLFYPDWGFANILYIQRVRATIFYDQTFTSNKINNFANSLGTEIYADTKWWNQHSLTFGVRYGYSIQTKKVFYELILPVAYF